MFLEKNPQYTEISERAFMVWAQKSGVHRNGGYHRMVSRDRPDTNFGIAALDDHSVSKMLKVIAPLQRRHYVVMDLKGVLIKDERSGMLDRWPADSFKKVAHVAIGAPPADFVKYSQ